MEICPICGITRQEQGLQQELVSVEFRMLMARWEQRNNPNELPPGLPLTHEARVHFALLLYHNDSSMDTTFKERRFAPLIATHPRPTISVEAIG